MKIEKKNEVYVTIKGDPHVHYELSDYFSFEVPEAKFLKRNPRYKYWDGMIRLYSPGTGELYGGLLDHLHEWANEKSYNTSYQPSHVTRALHPPKPPHNKRTILTIV